MHCPTCGLTFESQTIRFSGTWLNATIRGGGETCPSCGAMADTVEGTYNIIQNVFTVVTAPNMTRAEIDAAKEIASEAAKGSISSDDAMKSLVKVSKSLAAALQKPEGSRVNWEASLALLSLIITVWANHETDADAQAALKESQTQTAIAQKMLQEFQGQSQFLRELATKPTSQQLIPMQTTSPKNRADRRKAAAIARREKDPDR